MFLLDKNSQKCFEFNQDMPSSRTVHLKTLRKGDPRAAVGSGGTVGGVCSGRGGGF